VQQIGRYEVQEEIARGGMGVVFKARDPAANREVAIKVMLGGGASNPTRLKRFDREAKALAKLVHPNVVRILDYDTTPEGQPYMFMELVEGERSKLGDHAGAIEDYSQAIRLEPTTAAYNNRGVAYTQVRSWEGAVEDFEKALELDPNNALARGNLQAVRQKITDQDGGGE